MKNKNLYTERITMNYLMNVSSILLLLFFADMQAMQDQQQHLLVNGKLLPLKKYKEMAADGVDFKKADYESGWTLLHKAAEERDLPLTKWLIEEQKVDVNALYKPVGKTPLDFVVCISTSVEVDKKLNNIAEVISCLTEHGARFSGNWDGDRYNMNSPHVLKTYVAALSKERKQKFWSELQEIKRDACLRDNGSETCKNIRASIAILEKSL